VRALLSLSLGGLPGGLLALTALLAALRLTLAALFVPA
jgi:hypothetical protein